MIGELQLPSSENTGCTWRPWGLCWRTAGNQEEVATTVVREELRHHRHHCRGQPLHHLTFWLFSLEEAGTGLVKCPLVDLLSHLRHIQRRIPLHHHILQNFPYCPCPPCQLVQILHQRPQQFPVPLECFLHASG